MKTSRQSREHVNVYPQTTLEKFRRTLLRMRDLACAELGGLVEMVPQGSLQMLGAGTAETPEQSVHPAEFAGAAAEQERLLAYMDALDSALERIAAGRYGRCRVCGDPISEDRLEGLPCAERCAPCQARQCQSLGET